METYRIRLHVQIGETQLAVMAEPTLAPLCQDATPHGTWRVWVAGGLLSSGQESYTAPSMAAALEFAHAEFTAGVAALMGEMDLPYETGGV